MLQRHAGETQPPLLITLIKLKGKHGARDCTALVDSGATEDFISHLVAAEEELPKTPVNVTAHSLDGHTIPIFGQFSGEALVTDRRGETRSYESRFLSARLTGFDAVLGQPWLGYFNPDCDWKDHSFEFRKGSEIHVVPPNQFAEELRTSQAFMVVVRPASLEPSNVRLNAVRTGHVHETHEPRMPDSLQGAGEMQEVTLPTEYADFAYVFSKDGAEALPPEWMKVRHAVDLEPGTTAPWGTIYPASAKELAQLKEYITTNLELGRIRASTSPAGSPILFVPKKDGSMRLCVDYRGLNKITTRNRYPLPLISETLDRLSGARVFTKLDLRDAYYRIKIREGDEWKTAFRTRYGLFEYVVMPFGMTNAPSTFQAYMNEALSDLLDVTCIAYMDDIIIYSAVPEQHVTHVREVLARLQRASLFVKLSKCIFSAQEVDFLGYRISVRGISMDPERVRAVAEWPQPDSFHAIQVFIGFCNFYRRFIPEFSGVASPITGLLKGMQNGKKTGPFVWTSEAQAAFEELKRRFQTSPLLRHFDPELDCQLETDASVNGLSAILSQAHKHTSEGQSKTEWYPVAFWSRKTTEAEHRYQTGDQEMLAIVEAFREWQHYLASPANPVRVVTDHHNLQQFMLTKSLNRRQMRWAAEMGAYYFQIVWRAGKRNPADGLSRRPDYMRMGREGDSPVNPMNQILIQAIEGVYGSPDTTMLFSTLAIYQPPAGGASSDPDPGTVPGSLVTILLSSQSKDAWCRSVVQGNGSSSARAPMKGDWKVDQERLVRIDGAVYVPPNSALRKQIMQANHDDPWQGGHFGIGRTLETCTRMYRWEHMKGDVIEFVKSCRTCQWSKAPRHKPYGLLQPLPVPTRPWESISMDFISGLPPAVRRRRAYDAVLVIVCRFSKMCLYIPTTETLDAPGLAELLIEHVFAKYGAPKSIVSDRDKLISSSFWGSFCFHLTVRRNMTTAFRPQSDGQTERMNQSLECYLRCFSNFAQDNWVTLLPSAEYAHNSHRNESTKKTPFEMVLTFTPEIRPQLALEAHEPRGQNPQGTNAALEIYEATRVAREALEHAQDKMKKYYDGKHIRKTFEVGDKVNLSTKFIRRNQRFQKLADRFVGPFRITARRGQNAYQLDLPASYGKMHNTFHVSLLEPFVRRAGESTPEPEIIDGVEEFEVEEILDTTKVDGQQLWLVRWRGYGKDADTWQSREDLGNAREALEKFERTQEISLAQGPAKKRDRRGRPRK